MSPQNLDRILAGLRRLVALLDLIFLYGGRAGLDIAAGAAIVFWIVAISHELGLPIGTPELGYAAERVLMGAVGFAMGCWLVHRLV